MNPVMAAWAVEAGIISVRDLSGARRLPLPSEFLATFVVFGALSVVAGAPAARRPAVAVAWGLVVATLIGGLETFSKPQGNPVLTSLKSVSDFLSGSTGTAPAPQASATPATAAGGGAPVGTYSHSLRGAY